MADTYLFPCPHCEFELGISTRQAGQDTRCTDCGKAFVIPKLGVLKKLPREGESDESVRRGGSNRTASALFSVGLLLLVAAGAAGFFTNRYASTLIEEVDVISEMETNNKIFDDINGVQLWDTWEQFKMEGIGDYEETVFVKNNTQGKILRQIAYGLYGLAGLGLLLMLGSFLFKK